MKSILTASACATAALLAACSVPPAAPPTMFSQAGLPDAVKVPAGHKVALETVGVGQITYECRDKQSAAGQFEWVFIGPSAVLNDRAGKTLGKYYGPPATWESNDSSKLTGAQMAVAPAGSGNIPLQLVKANPATGQGSMNGMTFVQRVATRGGVAPASTCGADTKGRKEIVDYQADYIFWTAI